MRVATCNVWTWFECSGNFEVWKLIVSAATKQQWLIRLVDWRFHDLPTSFFNGYSWIVSLWWTPCTCMCSYVHRPGCHSNASWPVPGRWSNATDARLADGGCVCLERGYGVLSPVFEHVRTMCLPTWLANIFGFPKFRMTFLSVVWEQHEACFSNKKLTQVFLVLLTCQF